MCESVCVCVCVCVSTGSEMSLLDGDLGLVTPKHHFFLRKGRHRNG